MGTTVLAFSIIASGMMTITPAAAEDTVPDGVQAAEDLGKDCSKTADEILEGLITMGNTDKVTTVRHRGDFNATTPENSLQAFQNSYRACRPGIETDVRKTKDGQFVLFHDTKIGKMLEPSYDPITGIGPNEELSSLTYAELRTKNLVNINRQPTDQKIINLDTFLTDYVSVKGRSMINLEVKNDNDVLDVIKAFDRINKRLISEGSTISLFDRTIFKLRMTAYPTLAQFQQDLVKINILPSSVMAMPVMSAQLAEQIDTLPPIKPGASNTYAAVDSWSDAPGALVPSVEIVMKDAQGYNRYNYDFLYYGETESYLDMLPMTFPDSTTLANTREGTMAEMSELVKSKNKPLAQFVPIPDWAMWRSGFSWNQALPNVLPNSPTITPDVGYFNNDSKCCYALSDRLKSDGADREKADQRILLPFQEKIKATVLTADDTDSIDAYFKPRGKYLDLGDNIKNPNKPNPEMNSILIPSSRIPRATVAQTTNIITGTNQLINAEYRLCVNNENRRLVAGNPVKSWQCNGDTSNIWSFEKPDAEGYRKMIISNSSYCLNSQGRLGWADIWPCTDSQNAMWKFRSDGSIVDKSTKGCLSLAGDQSGSAIETQPCNGSGRQKWLTDYAENTYGIVGGGQTYLLQDTNRQCLNLYGNSGTTQVWTGTCVVTDDRTWIAWTSMVDGQGGYAPILQSKKLNSGGNFYMCARSPNPSSVLANSCEYRRDKEYQWYYTPEREIVNVFTGGCLKPAADQRPVTTACDSQTPAPWYWS